MKTKIIYLLLCTSMLFSCNYFQDKKEDKARQKMKNNIAEYVFIEDIDRIRYHIVNKTDYTIDEVVYIYHIQGYSDSFQDKAYYMKAHSTEPITFAAYKEYKKMNKYTAVNYSQSTQGNFYYAQLGEKLLVITDIKIVSIKCKALGLN